MTEQNSNLPVQQAEDGAAGAAVAAAQGQTGFKNKAKILAGKIWKARMAYLFLAPLMIGVLCFCYYPPILAIVRSFTGWQIGASSPNYTYSFDNYIRLFQDSVFLDSIWNMLYINIPKLIIGIVVPLIFAEMLFWVKRKKLSAVYRVMVLLPIITPGVIGTYLWTYIYRTDGLLNGLLGLFGADVNISWLNNAATVIPAIIFMGFPWIGGTSVLIYMSGLMSIPVEVGEAAKLDGARTMRVIWSLHLPSLMGQIRYFLVFGLIGAFQDYGIQVVLSGAGTVQRDIINSAIMVPGYYMYTQAFSEGNLGYACAIGTIIFLFVMIITAITFKVFNAQKFELD